ncbi:hypothetical protein RERY_57420 [Rhodococcus erythropolis]|nr:hypothetical protein RERY_57420 [Rhodococcus erythropolis]
MCRLVSCQNFVQGCLTVDRRDIAEIDVPPRDGNIFEDYLDRRSVVVGRECRSQVRITVDDSLCCSAQSVGIHLPGQSENHLHRVEVDAGFRQHRVEEQTGLQRCQGPDVGHRTESILEPVDISLAHGDKRHVGRCESTGSDGARMLHQGSQCFDPNLCKCLDTLAVDGTDGVCERGLQNSTVCAVVDDRIDVDDLVCGHVDVFGCRHLGEIAGRQPPESLDACRKILGDNSSQVVEADLSPGEARKHCARVFVQVAQQSVPDALVRDRQQLFLHCFDRASRRITSGESVTQIYLGKIETDREGSGEPANGP